MSDTIRAGKIIASAILIVGGFIALQTFRGEEGDRGPGMIIVIIGIILLLENWLLLFSSMWRAIRESYQSSKTEKETDETKTPPRR